MPPGERVLRRERRHAWKGTPGRPRATRKVETTYGRHQRARDREAAWALVFAAIRASKAGESR